MNAESPHSRYGSGKSVRRVEDDSLLTGRDQFADNFSLPGQACLAFVRSPHPHARITAIDATAAAAMPGVVAIVTGDDLVRAGVKPVLQSSDFRRRDGAKTAAPLQHALAVGVVRYVGEAVAAIVADTREQARDAAEALEVDYEPLPMVVDLADAIAPGAPLVWPEATGNIACQHRHGNAEAATLAMAAAAHVVSLDLVNQRLDTGADRAARDARGLRRRHRSHHAARELPDTDRDSRRNVQRSAGHRARQDAHSGRRRRRRVRHEDDALRRRHRRGLLRARR